MSPSAEQVEKLANLTLEEIIKQDLSLIYFSQVVRGAFNIKEIKRLDGELQVTYFSRPGIDDDYTKTETCSISDEARFSLLKH